MADGKDAADDWRPADASTEIRRVLDESQNYYMVLHVTPVADNAEIKRNYRRLSLVLHPDRCNLPRAKEAFQEINLAHTTLTTPVKRKMYDLYLGDRLRGAAGTESYNEWEARMATGPPVRVPAWLAFILRMPVIGMIVAVLLVLLLIPLVLVMLVLMVLLALLCLPCAMIGTNRPQEEGGDEAGAVGHANAETGGQNRFSDNA
ncbi:hypothetical protein CDCA_CDCA05G1535 [Cyanidium caldarium]|uniref:J domain-containing protein n=1 Tax=Cyanidium caldarium TaxID=2771 RepID=A0AAV9ITT6_CYACA|nr:hypothetical protein CDCA_CDCA05G1535 [Cyanidium caldarium]